MFAKIIAVLFIGTVAALADEKLPILKVKDEVYSNVTVTAVTATDIQFTHSRGLGNAKLKNLNPEFQKHFNYDAAKVTRTEQQQARSNADYLQMLSASKPPPLPAPDTTEQSTATESGDDFVAPKLHARSIRGQPAPRFVVEKWLTAQPATSGKFTLIDFWATWCGPCRASIPELNKFHKKYGDKIVVIGISDETEADVRKMKSPQIDYSLAIDTQERMMRILEIKGIPHCILIDPQGVVRFEGMPQYLDDQKLEHFLEKYK